MNKKKVLITSASGLGYPSLVLPLKKKFFIVGTSSEPESAGFAFVDKKYVISPIQRDSYVKDLLSVCKKEKVDVIMPVDPRELVKVSLKVKEFEKIGTKVLVSGTDELKAAEDKKNFFIFCKENNIPFPNFVQVGNFQDFYSAVKKLGYPEKEVCFKPAISSGTRGFRIISSRKETGGFFESQPGSVVTGFEEICAILKKEPKIPDLLVMEFMPGEEYSVDVLAKKGEAQIIIPRTRDRIILGASFAGKTVNEAEIISLSKKIVKGLNLDGVVGIQFRRDKNGTPKVLEVNPRVHGAVVLSFAAGANLVELAIKNILGIKWENPKINWDTKLIRYYDEVYTNGNGKFFKI